ncbi:hypothetical protein GGI15_000909 [Coemansia interrupta]|uniref:Homologous recombination OB-fold protein OB-fold domain-containing protein n=1 Tax=Coemansia interrupta TaxID=1126814 RepID=A0A9W8HMA0_9FUNG|nr:hypothetical protein GGI15_000909 [Coemansia interrupta]
MNPQTPSTGFAALDGLLKRAREQKKANPIPSKRVAVSGVEKDSSTDEGTRLKPQPQPRPPPSFHSESQTDIDGLDAADALLDFDPEDIDGLLDGLSTDNADTLTEASQPPSLSQHIASTPASLTTASSSQAGPAARPSQPLPRPQTPASSRLSQFRYQAPSAIDRTPRPSAIMQQAASAGSVAAKGSSSAFKTVIERTIVDSRKRRSRSGTGSRQEVPGPAGLVNRGSAEDCPDMAAPTQRPVSAFRTPFSASQQRGSKASDADFESGTWAAMLDFLSLPSYTPQTARQIQREHRDVVGATVQWVQRNAKQTQKVARMLVQIQDITGGGDADASSVLVDPTGEIAASIHRQVVADLRSECTAGTSVILENVVAMALPGARPFLVITSASIMRVFAVEATAGSRANPIAITQTQTQTQARAGQPAHETPTRGPNRAGASSAGDGAHGLQPSQQPTEADVFDSVFVDDSADGADLLMDMLDSEFQL